MHLVITDSGLGGLLVCAGIDRALRAAPPGEDVRLTYVNAWPEEGRGYNDLPDMPARATVFDRALSRMQDMRPDAIVIACNTLSIVYEHTRFRREGSVPVAGIVKAGVDLFEEALHARPEGSIVLLGTRTTIESGVHRRSLLERGVSPDRVAAASCHGLAAAIERGPDSGTTAALVETCAGRASGVAPAGDPLHIGLCCTHYAMVAERIRESVAHLTGRVAVTLDPNAGLVADVTARYAPGLPGAGSVGRVAIEVVSKVKLGEEQRDALARVIEEVSRATAGALRAYRHVPALFSLLLVLSCVL